MQRPTSHNQQQQQQQQPRPQPMAQPQHNSFGATSLGLRMNQDIARPTLGYPQENVPEYILSTGNEYEVYAWLFKNHEANRQQLAHSPPQPEAVISSGLSSPLSSPSSPHFPSITIPVSHSRMPSDQKSAFASIMAQNMNQDKRTEQSYSTLSHSITSQQTSYGPQSATEVGASVSPIPDYPYADERPLISAFAAIDQWSQNACAESDSHDEHDHWSPTRTPPHHSPTLPSLASFHRDFNGVEPEQKLKKVAHNAIERRYRNNINDRIQDLKNVVPALYKAHIREPGPGKRSDDEDMDDEEGTGEIIDGVEVAHKLNKATILHKATEYISFLKHSNDTIDQENLILQQLLLQLPGGNTVLNRFQTQKQKCKQTKEERLMRERKDAQERERAERQQKLKERAAQRAAVAELIPKKERKPYRRQIKRQRQQSDAEYTQENGNNNNNNNNNGMGQPENRVFMAMFVCLAFFAASPTKASSTFTSPRHRDNYPRSQTFSAYYGQATSIPQINLIASPGVDLWSTIRISLFCILVAYYIVFPLLGRLFRIRRVNHRQRRLARAKANKSKASKSEDPKTVGYQPLKWLQS
ncbi:helix-loop-helix DNA-binding domain-containing protein [Phycomyces nitens]|nr:helix-loop-helix DNA-binding domain-containing protein [Phycomyces nitens]